MSSLGFVVENMSENKKMFKKFKSSFLENDRLIYMINIFLILKIL